MLLTDIGVTNYVEMVCQLDKASKNNIVDISIDREYIAMLSEYFNTHLIPKLCAADAREVIRLYYFYSDSGKYLDIKRKLDQLLAYRLLSTNTLDTWQLEFIQNMESLMARYVNFVPTKKQEATIEKLFKQYRIH